MSLIEDLGRKLGKQKLPTIHVGDTVEVHYLIREGQKERIQIFNGTVLAIRGRDIARNIVVRRIVQGEGVERIFPLHSPRVKDIQVTRRGQVRRAKLYYLRERVGKMTRVRELLGARARRLKEREIEAAESQPVSAGQPETESDEAHAAVEV